MTLVGSLIIPRIFYSIFLSWLRLEFTFEILYFFCKLLFFSHCASSAIQYSSPGEQSKKGFTLFKIKRLQRWWAYSSFQPSNFKLTDSLSASKQLQKTYQHSMFYVLVAFIVVFKYFMVCPKNCKCLVCPYKIMKKNVAKI